MSNYLITHGRITVAPEGSIKVEKKLPAATYSVEFSKEEGFYLAPMENMEFSGKIYGNIEDVVDRITKAYVARKRNLGVLLSGIKGSGKSLTMKMLAKKVVDTFNIPAIIVSKGYPSHYLARFLYAIDMNCAVIFDEFDKNYAESLKDSDKDKEMDTSGQSGLLDLLDGIYTSQKLFVFCANKDYAVSEYMLNRPGRIFYHFRYKPLTMDIIREYLDDNIKNKDFIEEIILYSGFISNLTFDILKAIVEECNFFNEPISEFIDNMNINCNISDRRYKVVVSDENGVNIKFIRNERIDTSCEFSFYTTDENLIKKTGLKPDGDGEIRLYIPFSLANISDVKSDGTFCFHDKVYGLTLNFSPEKDQLSYLQGSRLGSIFRKENTDGDLFEQKSELWGNFVMLHPDAPRMFNMSNISSMMNNDAVTAEDFEITLKQMRDKIEHREQKRAKRTEVDFGHGVHCGG